MRTRWLSSLPLREGCCDLREDTENCENEEIVNSPVADNGSVGTSAPGGFGPIGNTEVVDLTLPASSDEGMEVDRAGSRSGSVSLGSTLVEDYGELSSSFEQVPYKGKKGRHKPKGSNALGSRAMAKISSRRLELEDDKWTRRTFLRSRRREAQDSSQKTAIEEITSLFPQMSPKSVVAKTLRVLDIAGEAERRIQTMNGALRRQIKRRFSRHRDPAVVEAMCEAGPSNMPSIYRPSLGRTRKKLEDVPPRPTKIDRSGHIIRVDLSRIASDDCIDSRVDKRTVRGGSEAVLLKSAGAQRVELSPPLPTYSVDEESWMVVASKRARKRARKKKGKKEDVLGMTTGKTADLDAVSPPSTRASGARRVVAGGDAPKTICASYVAAGSVPGNVPRSSPTPTSTLSVWSSAAAGALLLSTGDSVPVSPARRSSISVTSGGTAAAAAATAERARPMSSLCMRTATLEKSRNWQECITVITEDEEKSPIVLAGSNQNDN
ncbi:hypothetical protein G5I_13287 [Acromyrmex echinatior]|uniref:Uncharacterized protein n=1 Tax=Acromyrmex echinatior TaxID=103372 RepID=F4X4M1_ACREC|nr:hypothetical protein G5I_13287 [Acromyrmex echinatior]